MLGKKPLGGLGGNSAFPSKKIVGGGNKFAVKSDAVSAMTNKLGINAKATSKDAAPPIVKKPSPMKLHVSSPGKVSPLAASLNTLNPPKKS